MSVLFCNIGWMAKYDGIQADTIQRGGSYNKDSTGHEVCNFSDVDGKVYGYVQPTGQIKIERLGVSKKDQKVSGVTVVWTAGPDSGGTAVVGWYKNATVFREPQTLKKRTKHQKANHLDTYRIVAPAEDATLLPIEKRSLMIPRAVKGGIGQSNVWYADSPDSQKIVNQVLELIDSNGDVEHLPDVDEEAFGYEGNPRLVLHMKRERNASLVKKKKEQVLKQHGALECEVCGFNFHIKYGEHGDGFCEVHHLVPLHKADIQKKTELKDLSVVCSNCHRIIHKMKPMPTIPALRKIVEEHANA